MAEAGGMHHVLGLLRDHKPGAVAIVIANWLDGFADQMLAVAEQIDDPDWMVAGCRLRDVATSVRKLNRG